MKSFLFFLIVLVPLSLKAEMGVIAHRGASSKAPENTMAALKKAVELGSTIIEIDVQLTSDAEVILMHDHTLDRTTNGFGAVEKQSLKKIQDLDAGSWFSSHFKNEKVPHLEDALTWLPNGITLIIEVKSKGTNNGIEKKIVDLLEKTGKSSQVWVKSFDKNVLKNFDSHAPNLPKVFVFIAHTEILGMTLGTSLEWSDLFSELKSLNVKYLQPHSFFLTTSLASKMKKKGFNIVAWGVNTKRRLRQMQERSVDFIETDYPFWAMDLIKKGL